MTIDNAIDKLVDTERDAWQQKQDIIEKYILSCMPEGSHADIKRADKSNMWIPTQGFGAYLRIDDTYVLKVAYSHDSRTGYWNTYISHMGTGRAVHLNPGFLPGNKDFITDIIVRTCRDIRRNPFERMRSYIHCKMWKFLF